jgi:glycosyltransferase involved in cell wall biosynthesis
MSHGLVTTIIPVYNRPAQLREAVASVLTQNYRPIEVIIVDDGSTDVATQVAARELAAANPGVVFPVVQTNAGPGAAREHGRKLAQGEFIQYLDSDDLLLPGKFAAQVAALRARPDADVAYGITYMRDASGQLIESPHKDTGKVFDTMFPTFLNSRWWDTSTPLYRASVCAQAGPWSTLKLEEDWEYDCRIASLGGKLAWCQLAVSETRDHHDNRLSRGSALDPSRQKQRATAQGRIFQHALAFGLTPANPEMQVFSRSLFLLSRQCGAAGLPTESRQLFQLASDTCEGDIVPASLRRPSCSESNCAVVIPRAISASRIWIA